LNGSPFTPAHAATLRRMSAAGFDDIQIARATGHSVKTIRRKRHEMQLPNYFVVRYSNWGTLTADARRAISVITSVA
jgi:hypothetical protein